MRLLLVACCVGLILPLVLVTPVFGHAEPARVFPGDGAVLAEAPASVEIEMSQEMARREDADGNPLNDIDVIGPDGTEVTVTSAAIDNADRRKISVSLPADLPTGTYEVRWKTLSAEDGDNDDGVLTFTIDPSQPADPGQENLRDDPLPGGTDGNGAGATDAPEVSAPFGDGDAGTSWVLVAAVAVGMFVLGSGTTYLLVQKQP